MRILADNYVKTSTITALTETLGYEFNTALKDTRLSRIARTIDLTNQTIDFDLGIARGIDYTSILKHNLTASATVTIQGFTNNPLIDPTIMNLPLKTDALDISGNGNNGTATDITWTGGVANFNGTSSKIVYDFADITYPKMTICFWFKMSTSSQMCMFDTRLTSGDGGSAGYNTSAMWTIDNLSGSTRAISDYADGNLHFASTELSGISLNYLTIGMSYALSYKYTGTMSNFYIFNGALSDAERTALYTVNDYFTPDFTQSLTITDSIVQKLSSTQTYQYWRLALSDATNTDTFISISKVYLGGYVQLPNMGKSQKVNTASTSDISESNGLQSYGNPGIFYQYGDVTFPIIEDSEKLTIENLFRLTDKYTPVILLIWENDLTVQPAIYSRITNDMQFTRVDGLTGRRWSLNFSFKETF